MVTQLFGEAGTSRGSQSWRPILAAAAFQAAFLLVGEVSACNARSVSVFEREAASKGGCSQDWLPRPTPSTSRLVPEEAAQLDDQNGDHQRFEDEGARVVEFVDHEFVELAGSAQFFVH
jgi:hypothetical protein